MNNYLHEKISRSAWLDRNTLAAVAVGFVAVVGLVLSPMTERVVLVESARPAQVAQAVEPSDGELQPVEVEPIDLQYLTKEASQIVYGTIGSSHVEWFGQVVYTLYEFTPIEAIKGESSDRISVAIRGGCIGAIWGAICGDGPTLHQGEEIVLFGKPLRSQPSKFRTGRVGVDPTVVL